MVVAGATAALVLAAALSVWAFGGAEKPPEKTISVYSDDFSSDGSNWGIRYQAGSTGYIGGTYRTDTTDVWERVSKAAPFKGDIPDRLLIGVDAYAVAGPDYARYGVWCRGEESGAGPGYHFTVRHDGKGVQIRRVTEDRGSRTLHEKDAAPGFEKGKQNRVQAACEQQGKKVRLRLWLNGKLAAEYTDSDAPLPNGKAGIVATTEGGGGKAASSAVFDNFELKKIG